MKCTNCGQEVEKNWKFCPNCKTPITTKLENENLEINEQEPTKKNSNASTYIIIYIISMISSFIFNPFSFYLALVTIIIGKIRCPKNVPIKILFYITIALVLFYTILIVWLVVSCTNPATYRSCQGLG